MELFAIIDNLDTIANTGFSHQPLMGGGGFESSASWPGCRRQPWGDAVQDQPTNDQQADAGRSTSALRENGLHRMCH
jgi:hypothetical protein